MDRPALDDVHSQVRLPLPLKLASRLLALGLLGFCGWQAWAFPVAPVWLSAGLAVYLLTLWRWPAAWLLAVPAALPVLDLAYWSGRFFFNAYDLLILTSIAAGLWRARPWLGHLDRTTGLLILVLLGLHSWITLNGLLPLHSPAAGAWQDYFASTNALREFKGLLWALLLWPMLATARGDGIDIQRWLTAGLLTGLAAAIATIVWERGLFTGLLNFASPYRISGWFSVMLTGGAAIDAFLALTTPFVAAAFVLFRSRWLQLIGIVLGVGALYALYVTYSRANYPAMGVMVLVMTSGLWLTRRQGQASLTRVAPLMAMGLLLAITGLLALTGKNIQQRFDTTLLDLAGRITHLERAVAILGESPQGFWLGAGKGSFPRDYFWHSQAQGQHLALAQLYREGGESFIRFSKSDSTGNLFLRQRIETGDGPHRLVLTLRTPHGPQESLLIEFCERHILKYRDECRWYKVKVPQENTQWQNFEVPVTLHDLGKQRFGPFGRPVDISLMNRGIQQGLDIAAVQIHGPDGRTLLANPDFSSGWDHWFLSYGDHLRWHIKNVFVYWLYEGGILGLLVMLGTILLVAWQLYRAIRKGDRFAVLTAAALASCLMVGLFDSLFDEPRIATLFFLLVGAGLIGRPSPATLSVYSARADKGITLLQLRQGGIALAAGGLLLLFLAYLFAPRFYMHAEIALLSWAETNAPTLSNWLQKNDSATPEADIKASLPPWQPWPAADTTDGEIRIGDRHFSSLRAATASLRDGDHLEIGAGIYRHPLVIRAQGVRVTGRGHVIIERTSAEDKAAIITKGNDIRIENIECRDVRVPDQNGACIRHEAQHLTLDHVYFHHAEQGILTGSNPGKVTILDSRFERLGKFGLSHGIYIGGGELHIADSQFLASKSWGHEIKSRASHTRIERTLIASLSGVDSRLLDLPHGGILQIYNSVLEQGPTSSNEGAIGIGLEGRLHAEQGAELAGNIIILEREGGNRLFQLADGLPAPVVKNNLVISADNPGLNESNLWLQDRASTSLGDYPALPAIPADSQPQTN